MTGVFLKIVDLGMDAGFLILAVMAARLLLSKAPKSAVCLLWALVAVRLVAPFQVQSAFSLVPDLTELVSVVSEGSSIRVTEQENRQQTEEASAIENGSGNEQALAQETQNAQPVAEADAAARLNNESAGSAAESVRRSDTVGTADWFLQIGAIVWLVGVAAMLCYLLVSMLMLRRKVSARIRLRGNVYLCDDVKSPCIVGVFRPIVCIPSGMEDETVACVLRHERAHLRRRDQIWKPLGFLILSVYWFCPLCWAAYILFCRDVEFACDERAVRGLDDVGRAGYCQALLDCSMSRRLLSVCPVAFGEIGVKKRIRAVADYRKPTFWALLAVLAVCVIVAVCFFTSPRDTAETARTETEAVQTETVRTETVQTETEQSSEAENAEAAINPEEAENAVCLTYGDATLLGEEENAALYQKVRTLLAQRDALHKKLMSAGTDYVDMTESFTVTQENGTELIYYRVTETDSWDFYENQALELYSSDYVTNIFTPFYIGRGIFTEEDARLYRELSDTPYSPILTDTARIWAMQEGGYAVSAYEENDSGYDLYLFRIAEASDKPYGVELLEEERYDAGSETTVGLSFEDLIAMVNSEDWNSFVTGTDADYWREFNNFTDYDMAAENLSLTNELYADYVYNARNYELQVYYVPESTAEQMHAAADSIDSIYLMETDAEDILLLYSADKAIQPDIDGFLSQTYDVLEAITMDSVVLTGNTDNLTLELGNYTASMFLGFSGSLFDYDPGIGHGEFVPESWYSAGGIGVMESGKNTELDEYDNHEFVYDADGKLSQVAISDNHMEYAYVESFETEDFTGLLYEYDFDLYTASEAGEVGLDTTVEYTSKFWVIFLDSGEDEPTYVLFFNKLCFSKDQALAYARTVRKR